MPSPHGPRWSVRYTLGFGVLTGLLMAGFFLFIAEETPLAWDFIAYVAGAEAFLSGDDFVGLQPSIGRGEYVYPPIVLIGFIPYAMLDNLVLAYALHTILNVGLLVALGWLCVRELTVLGVDLSTSDIALIYAFFLTGLYSLISIGLGQIDPLIALLVAGMFLAHERGQSILAGGLIGLAVVVKLFPAAFAIWLIRFRDWRSVTATWLVGSLLGGISLIGFGLRTHIDYVQFLVHDRSRLDEFAEGMSPDFFAVSLARPVASAPVDITPITYALFALLLVSPPLYLIYRRVDTRLDRHVAYLATIVAILIALPTTNINHLLYAFFPLVIVVYRLMPGSTRTVLLVGMAILMFPIQPGQVTTTLSFLGLPDVLIDVVGWLTIRVFKTASVALIGSLVILMGCVLYAIDGTTQEGLLVES